MSQFKAVCNWKDKSEGSGLKALLQQAQVCCSRPWFGVFSFSLSGSVFVKKVTFYLLWDSLV